MPTPGDALFFVVAGAVIAAAAGVAFARNLFHSVLSLLATLLGVGALFLFLSASFLAVAQLLIYAGGVVTLILGAVLLTHPIDDGSPSNPSRGRLAGAVLSLGLLGAFGSVALTVPWGSGAPASPGQGWGHWAPVAGLGLLLVLAAVVGAVVVARREPAP